MAGSDISQGFAKKTYVDQYFGWDLLSDPITEKTIFEVPNSSSNLQFMKQFHVTDNFRTPDEQLSMFRCLDEVDDLRAHTM